MLAAVDRRNVSDGKHGSCVPTGHDTRGRPGGSFPPVPAVLTGRTGHTGPFSGGAELPTDGKVRHG